MKKLLLTVFTLILAISLAACGGGSNPAGGNNSAIKPNIPSGNNNTANPINPPPVNASDSMPDSSSGTGGAADSSSNDLITSDNPAFAGDMLKLFGLDLLDAVKTLGVGFTGEITRGGETITNQDGSVFVKLSNSINRTDIFVVREIALKDAADISFCGIKIGDTLTDAEQRLTKESDKITGGVIGWILEIDGTVSDITIGNQLFFSKEEVKQYMMSAAGRTISWTAEIDGTVFNIDLTTSDNKTIDSIAASSYDNDEIQLGIVVPFPEVELNNSFSIPSKPVGLEGLDPKYWE